MYHDIAIRWLFLLASLWNSRSDPYIIRNSHTLTDRGPSSRIFLFIFIIINTLFRLDSPHFPVPKTKTKNKNQSHVFEHVLLNSLAVQALASARQIPPGGLRGNFIWNPNTPPPLDPHMLKIMNK